MTSDPRARALAVVRRALQLPSQVELFVAMQYLSMLRDDALAPLREADAQDDIIGRILSVPPAPEPAYARPRRVPEMPAATRAWMETPETPGRPLASGRVRHRVGGRRNSLFARWVEGEIEWSPAVMGWSDDDPRAEGWHE